MLRVFFVFSYVELSGSIKKTSMHLFDYQFLTKQPLQTYPTDNQKDTFPTQSIVIKDNYAGRSFASTRLKIRILDG